MKKIVALTTIFVIACVFPRDTHAALVKFGLNGDVYWNVLGMSSDSALEIKKIADKFVGNKSTSVNLTRSDGQVYLSYDGQKLTLSEYGDEIVEIEEKVVSKKILITSTESGFAIKQNGITAETPFSIQINSTPNKIAIETSTGQRFLSVFPYEAVERVVLTNIINTLPADGKIKILEEDGGEVAYQVSGEKQIQLFNIFSFSVPVVVTVSATSGKVVSIDQPLWYSIIDFLLA